MNEKFYDVIIVGAGPGGLTSAIYASRSNLKTLIVDKGIPGGQLQNTEEIENFPGFSHISGPDLATKMYEHALKFGAEYKYGDVKSIKQPEFPTYIPYFEVEIGKDIYKSYTVIIATGTKHRKLGIPGEDKLSGRGVSWCAVCDGAFFKNKELVVVGGGDSAVEEAIYLTKFASKVKVIHRRDKFRAQPILVDRMKKNEKIEIIYNATVKEILGDNKVSGVIIEDVNTGCTQNIDCEGVFEYVGMDPVSGFVGDLNIADEQGWIVTNEAMRTKVDGIYAVGDIRQGAIRQVVTATGDGCIAAQTAQHYIEMIKD